jgi:signal transduction histidine kinase
MIDRDPFLTRSPFEQVEIARRQRLVVVSTTISIVFSVLLGLFVSIAFLSLDSTHEILAYTLIIGIIPVSIFSWVLAHNGKPDLASYFLLFYISGVLGLNSLLIEGLSPALVPGFLLLIALSGVMLPPIRSFIFASLAIIVYLAVRIFSGSLQTTVSISPQAIQGSLSFMIVMAFIFIAVLNYLITRDLRRALDDATYELIRMNNEVRDASDRKSQFTARTSHELRTPLSAIIVFADLTLRGAYGPLSDKLRNAQQHIVNSARHLKHIINDLLDLSKIEAGEFEIEYESFSIMEVVDVMESSCLPIAEAKGLEWSITIDKSMPPLMEGDPERISQIAVNLAGNAVKFTEQGQVQVTIEPVDQKTWRLVVRDTGPGIPEDQQEKVFEAFRSLDKSGSKSVAASTGLGLAIARNLAQMMGGEIHLHSQLGVGSTFEVCLPLIIPEEDKDSIAAIA